MGEENREPNLKSLAMAKPRLQQAQSRIKRNCRRPPGFGNLKVDISRQPELQSLLWESEHDAIDNLISIVTQAINLNFESTTL